MSRLFVFPVRFPFTNIVECFLNEEVSYLSKSFDEVIFVPLKKEVVNPKPLPDNCNIIEPIFSNKYLFFLRGLFCTRTFGMLWSDFFGNRVWSDLSKFKIWLIGYITINSLVNSRQIKNLEKTLRSEDVCYFYWGKWSNALAILWKDKAKCVSRFHGWGDLWEADYNEYFPLRKLVMGSLKCAIHISSIGEKYFLDKYPNCKMVLHRLGSFDNGCKFDLQNGSINIISCSSLWPLKRVDLIIDSVYELSKIIDKPISYTHIGGNHNEVEKMETYARTKLNDNLHISFLGSMPHDDVLKYYQTHACDVFINLSTTEGVPVSIMEAISFNIPTVATNVGGTSDVVKNGVSGELVSENPSPKEVASAILKVLNNMTKYQPRKYWDDNFNASKNYTNFAEFLKRI